MKILYLNYSGSVVQFTRTYGVAGGLKLHGHEVIVRNMHRVFASQSRRMENSNSGSVNVLKTKVSTSPRMPHLIAVIIGELRRLLGNIRYLQLEFELFIKHKPDLIIIRPVTNWSFFLSAFICGRKYIVDTDGPLLEAFRYGNTDLPLHYLKTERIFMKRAKSITAISTEMKKYYASFGGDPHRIFICPNGIDPERFKPEIDASAVRDKYHLNKNTVIGFMGNLEPWHGLPGLLNQFPSIAEKYKNVRLLLVGITLDWDNLPDPADSHLIEYRDRIICTGRIPFNSMPEHLKAIDIFVLPYPGIDFFYFSPVKLFESMGVGCAVVAAGVGQIAEVINDGEDGLLFPPGDYISMKLKIEKLIEDPGLRNQLGKSAAENMHSNYTWQKITEGMISAFNYTYG